jgi:hypothetical protein
MKSILGTYKVAQNTAVLNESMTGMVMVGHLSALYHRLDESVVD